MAQAQQMPVVGGAVVYWNVGRDSDRATLAAALAQLHLDQFTPDARKPLAALGVALQHTAGGPKVLIRPLDRKATPGFAVVDEERGATENLYHTRFVALLDKDERVRVEDQYGTLPVTSILADSYAKARRVVTPSAVSTALVGILEHLGGTRLRPNGAIYWLPEFALPVWERVSAAVELAAVDCTSSVYLLRTVMDDAAIRAVRDAIVYEVTLAAEAIQQDVAQGDLGDQALVNREGKAKDLHERVSQYEFILGEALDKLHEVVNASQQAAASAMAIQEHSSSGAFEAVFG